MTSTAVVAHVASSHPLCDGCAVLTLAGAESPPPAYSQHAPPHRSISDTPRFSVQPLAFELTHNDAAGVATVLVQLPGGSQAPCGLSLGSVLVASASSEDRFYNDLLVAGTNNTSATVLANTEV